jgi:hypothetical protein
MENKGEQWVEPNNKPSEQHNYKNIRKDNDEEIAKGAQQEDQLDKLKPGTKTAENRAGESPNPISPGDPDEDQ